MLLGLSSAVWRRSILFHNGGAVGRFVIPGLLILSISDSNTKRQRKCFSAVFASLALQGYGVALFGEALGRCVCCANSRFAMPFRCGISCKTHQTHHTQTRRTPNPKGAFPARPGEHPSIARCMAGNRKAFLFCGSDSVESTADLVRIAVEGVELLGDLLFQHEAEVGVIRRVGVRILRLCRLV